MSEESAADNWALSRPEAIRRVMLDFPPGCEVEYQEETDLTIMAYTEEEDGSCIAVLICDRDLIPCGSAPIAELTLLDSGPDAERLLPLIRESLDHPSCPWGNKGDS